MAQKKEGYIDIFDNLSKTGERRDGCNYCTLLYDILLAALKVKDNYTQGHSIRVQRFAEILGVKAGLDSSDIKKIKVASILHDLGKIGIELPILNKPKGLTAQEYEKIKTHPGLSVSIVSAIPVQGILDIILHHHEKFDGLGYPEGIAGDKIPHGARILAVADTFDAMTSDRPYRKGLKINKVLAEIERCSGSQFDPEITRHLTGIPTVFLQETIAFKH